MTHNHEKRVSFHLFMDRWNKISSHIYRGGIQSPYIKIQLYDAHVANVSVRYTNNNNDNNDE